MTCFLQGIPMQVDRQINSYTAEYRNRRSVMQRETNFEVTSFVLFRPLMDIRPLMAILDSALSNRVEVLYLEHQKLKFLPWESKELFKKVE